MQIPSINSLTEDCILENSHKISEERTVRNRIDYIPINGRYKNSIRSAKTYPGADVFSDHESLVVRFQIRFKRIQKLRKHATIELNQLQDQEIHQMKEKINNNSKQLQTNGRYQREQVDIKEKWKIFETELTDTTNTETFNKTTVDD